MDKMDKPDTNSLEIIVKVGQDHHSLQQTVYF